MKKDYRNICLTGFMGAGKTSVGKLLGQKLGWKFYDTDKMIEERMGLPIPEIFDKFGEDFFRQQEEGISLKALSQKKSVVALGGGTYTNLKVQKKAQNSLVICLSISFKNFLKSLKKFKQTRPLLKDKTAQQIQELYNLRAACYLNCDLNLDVNELSPEQITNKILEIVKKQ